MLPGAHKVALVCCAGKVVQFVAADAHAPGVGVQLPSPLIWVHTPFWQLKEAPV